jgi:hypothetical protein
MSTAIESAPLGAHDYTTASHHSGLTCEKCAAAPAGPLCGQCGQRHHAHPVRSFWSFLQAATEDLTHADLRLWLTRRAAV